MAQSVGKQRAAWHREIVTWMDGAFAALHESRWAPQLTVDGVDVLDALRSQLFLHLLHVTRESVDGSESGPLLTRLKYRLRISAYHCKQWWRDQQTRRRSAPLEPAEVLLWPQHFTHVKSLKPIADALRKMGVTASFIANYPHVFDNCLAHGETPIYTHRWWPKEIGAARMAGRTAAKGVAIDPDVELPPLTSMTQTQIVAAFRSVLECELPLAYEDIRTASLAIDSLHPWAIVVGNDITREGRAQCLVAKARNVGTASPMHGVIAGEPLQGMHRADQILAYGERSRQEFIDLGEDPARIVITGAGYLQKRVRQSGQVNPAIRQRLNLRDNQPWCLVITSGPGHAVSLDHHLKVLEGIAQASVALPDVCFAIKLHPKDRVEYYNQVRAQVPNSRWELVTPKTTGVPSDIFSWLQGCPCALTCASAAGLEAILMDVPLVTMDFLDELETIDYIDAGASIHVRSGEQLTAAIRHILEKDNTLSELRERMQTFIRESFHDLDGDPSRLAAESINKLSAHTVRGVDKTNMAAKSGDNR